jgi:hypothetical protein
MGIGIAFGMPFGFMVSMLIGMFTGGYSLGIASGPAFGVALGRVIGVFLEKRHAHELRPLTRKEMQFKHRLVVVGLFALFFGMLAFVFLMFV